MYRKTLAFALLLSLLGLSAAVLPSYLASKVNHRFEAAIEGPVYSVDASGDWLVHSEIDSANGQPPYVSVLRRDANGMYSQVANITDYYTDAPVTNGEWIAIPDRDEDTPEVLLFYKLENNGPVFFQSFDGDYYFQSAGFVGNAFVAENQLLDTTVFDIYTFNGTRWNYDHSVDMGDHAVSHPYDSVLSRDRMFVVTYNETHVNVWQFDFEASTLKVKESVAAESTSFSLIRYNGVDTILLMQSYLPYNMSVDSYGYFMVMTKQEGKWILTQTSAADDFGVLSSGNLGNTGIWLNENSFVLTAVTDGSDSIVGPAPIGRALGFMRNSNGIFDHIFDVKSNESLSLGFNVIQNSYGDLIIPGFDTLGVAFYPVGYIFTACFTSTIDVTCNNMTFNDCSGDLPLDSLYTLNAREGCGTVNATATMSEKQNDQITVNFKFTKQYAADVMCSSVVTCPSAPIAAPVAPVAAPVKPPTGKKNSGSVVELGVALVLTVAALAM